MAVRRIDANELGRLIADRAVLQGPPEAQAARLSMNEYTKVAVKLVKNGQTLAAAAIFEAAREANPGDPTAHNNYGFCILPDRPDEALAALEQAAKLFGDSMELVNVANRLLALRRLGRITTALELAERLLLNWDSVKGSVAHMWSFDDDDPSTLIDVDNIKTYTLDLVVRIAEDSGDELLIKRWRRTRGSLAGDG